MSRSKSKRARNKPSTTTNPPPSSIASAQQGAVVEQMGQGHREIVAAHSGPLPTPADFAKYDATLPGAAERILKMAEEEQRKRTSLIEKTVNDSHATQKRGQWMGLAVILVALGVVAYGLYRNQGWPAFGLGSAMFAALLAGYRADIRSNKQPPP